MRPGAAMAGEAARLASSLAPALRPVGDVALLQRLTTTAQGLFGAAACSLAVLSDDDSELHYEAATGAGAEQVVGLRRPAGTGLAGWVVQSQQPIAVSDLAGDSRFDRATAERTGYVPDAMMLAPVMVRGHVLGVLSVLDRDAARPGAGGDLVLLGLLADQAGVVLEGRGVFADLGRVLLAAIAQAAEPDGDLALAAREAADEAQPADALLAELAAVFAALARRGAAERRLATGILTDIGGYVGRRSTRTR